jgi:hypothetical protein
MAETLQSKLNPKTPAVSIASGPEYSLNLTRFCSFKQIKWRDSGGGEARSNSMCAATKDYAIFFSPLNEVFITNLRCGS